MPAVSQAQQEAAGADLRRMRAGLAPRTFKIGRASCRERVYVLV